MASVKRNESGIGRQLKTMAGGTQQDEAKSILEFQKIPFVLFSHNLLVPTQGLANHHGECSKEEKLHPLPT